MRRSCTPFLLLPLAMHVAMAAHAEAPATGEPVALDEVSVIATRAERLTQDVPQAITVIGSKRIEQANMFNVKDVISGTPGVLIESKNGGYDARLIIRGAGLKAPYGIREIMVLRDGVPVTDPDSMTRLDWIDPQEISSIEISKGPGNLYSVGSFGGAIQIQSKSVFGENLDVVRIGAGDYGTENFHVRTGGMISDSQAMSISASYRSQDNDWRAWNEFTTSNFGLKHGLLLADDGVLETELSYSEADLQLPGSMSAAQFDQFKASGEQSDTQDAWKHSGRYSQIWFFNTRYEQKVGDLTVKPRLYANQWRHYHPVTGLINDNDWVRTVGTDLEGEYAHRFGGVKATLVSGVTYKQSGTDNALKYTYRDVQTQLQSMPPPPRNVIVATLSDERGDLAEVSNFDHRVAGLFLQETLFIGDRWTVDVGGRFDRSEYESDENEIRAYDFATRTYKAGSGQKSVSKDFNLPAPKLGVSYKVVPAVSLWGSVAQGAQLPSDSEITANPDLNYATSTQVELGLKARKSSWSLDASVYQMDVKDEIVTLRVNGENQFVNAGQTGKQGFDLSGSCVVAEALQVGLNYSFSDYEYEQFTETVRSGPVVTNVDRSGKQLPFIPRNQYAVFADYRIGHGFKARAQTNVWGKYYLDNANSETYNGYAITNLNVSWEHEKHLVALNVENLFDRRYAVQVSKDTSSNLSYTAGVPRMAMLNYSYRF